MANIDKGTVFGGRYSVQSQVGNGGMATVYRGVDNVLDRPVAIKVMLPQYANDPAFAQRFKQEAQAAAALQNPYIVQVYDWGRDSATGTYYIVMEYLRGTDLKTGIRSHGALAPRKVAQIGAQVCSALSVAHAHDIIHRDIKPQNIMIQPNGDAKVMDFGIARAKNSHLTQTNSVLGTAHYVSPEQAQGRELGPTSDLYSLGVVMYEAATGRLPFDGDDAVSVALKQVNERAVPPSEINPNVDDNLEAVIMRCMSKDPRERFQTADELRRVLNNYINGRPLGIPAYTPGMGGTTSRLSGGAAPTSMLKSGEATRTMRMGGTGSGTQRMTRETERLGMGGSRGTMGYGTPGGANPAGGNGRGRVVTSEPERGGFPAWAIAVIAAVAVILLVLLFALVIPSCSSGGSSDSSGTTTDATDSTATDASEKVTVPDVSGLDQQAARTRLEDAGFKVGTTTEESSTTVDKGKVIRTSPSAKTSAAKGSTVSLVVSKGADTGTLPTLTKGMTEDQVKSLLQTAGFTPEHDESLDDYDDEAAEGTFVKLDPTVGNSVTLAKGTTVKYGLSKGKKTCTVPTGLTNIPYWDAVSMLEAAGITAYYTDSNWEYSDTVAENYVIAIDEVEGSQITVDSNGNAYVTLTISRGPEPVTIPDFTGSWYSADSAASTLTNLGLSVSGYDTSTSAPDTGSVGRVYATSPSAGSQVSKGSSVYVYVYGDYVPPAPTSGTVPTGLEGGSVASALSALSSWSSVSVVDDESGIAVSDYTGYVVTSVSYAGQDVSYSQGIIVYVAQVSTADATA